MKVIIELTELDVTRLVAAEIERRMGDIDVPHEAVVIETKSKQNYRSEWEKAAFRVRAEVETNP